MKLLVATSNRGKLVEIREILAGLGLELVSLEDLRLPPPEETAETFHGNAEQKAIACARQSGLWTLADDSGLCVDALGGAPGVHSARYAENDEKRRAMEQLQTLLLGALEARGRVLVKLNVDEANLSGVIALLPALKSPTVSKLYGEDGYAVETVVAKSDINILIPALKDHGATGILELPIGKIVQ